MNHRAKMPQDTNNRHSQQPVEDSLASEISRQDGLQQHIMPLVPIEQQVGVHVIRVLQQPDTVAVLTTVMSDASGQQHIVSVGLNQDLHEQIEALLNSASMPDDRVPCVGFHCYLPSASDSSKRQADNEPSS